MVACGEAVSWRSTACALLIKALLCSRPTFLQRRTMRALGCGAWTSGPVPTGHPRVCCVVLCVCCVCVCVSP